MDIHKNRIILTIGRQFGSGGREIGKKLAKAFGIGYYDSELITVAAQESGLSVLCVHDWLSIHGDIHAL